MLVRSIDETRGSSEEVDDGQWVSRRMILAGDHVGYSVHDTEIRPGEELHMWYKHHFETVLITEGAGEIEDLGTGQRHRLAPGVLYCLNEHDKHILRAWDEGLRMTCVFHPALHGAETHQQDGSYPLLNAQGEVVEN